MTDHVRLLAGDIGGTKTKLAVYQRTAFGVAPLLEKSYASGAFERFDDIVADFLDGARLVIDAACFGVAGPVSDGRCQTTNLPWLLDEREIAAQSGISRVRLLNDLQAMALGLLQLPPDQFVDLNPQARQRQGNIAVIAAGTGLGEAILCRDGVSHRAIATEGGHADFAPNGTRQDGLLGYLRRKFGGHVSYERILSGPGLFNVYQYLRDCGIAVECAEFGEGLARGQDPGSLIGQLADQFADPLCVETLRLFAAIYGAEAGNLALKSLAVGGVLIGGGIAPKILPWLQTGEFLAAFCAKGRFSEWMALLPVRVALNPDAALLGAASAASAEIS